MDYWLDLYEDFKETMPEIPEFWAVFFVTYVWITIQIRAWWDCDFRIFRFKVRIIFRKILFRIIRGL